MAGWVGGKSGELDGQQHRGKSFMYLYIFKTERKLNTVYKRGIAGHRSSLADTRALRRVWGPRSGLYLYAGH